MEQLKVTAQTNRQKRLTPAHADWRAFCIIVLVALTVLVGALYSPTVDANFQGDDFGYMHFLFFNFKLLLDGRAWNIWLASFPWTGGWLYFRPVLQLFSLLDYTAWDLNPLGYHLTNLILHVLTAFLLFVLSWQLTRNRFSSIAAATLFAIMPIHVETVSWFAARADGLNALWYLVCLVFFVLYRERGRKLFLTTSIVAFVMALLSKEAGATIPLVLFVYEMLYNFDTLRREPRVLWSHVLFWSILFVYVGLRFAFWGLGGAGFASRLSEMNLDYISQAYLLAIVDPFLLDMTGEIRWAILGIAGIGFFVFRNRRELWLGAAWVCFTILPSLLSVNQAIFDRYVYLPSVGLALLLGSILTLPLKHLAVGMRAISVIVLLVFLYVYSTGVYARNEAWARAAQITQIVTRQLLTYYPTIPPNSRLVFTNVPVLVGGRGMQAFGNMLPRAVQLAYRIPNLEVYNFGRFPIWLDKLDRTYLFEYAHRDIIERDDLVQALKQRKQCADFSMPVVTWDFSGDAQGWEPWNQLSDFAVQAGTLIAHADGNDPYMASPPLEIPAIAIGDVEITMRVQAKQATSEGSVYWLAAGQQDFSPALKTSFKVQADGEFHTYRASIGQSGQLLLGDRILRLRFDPVKIPADITIRTIRVYTHCSIAQSDSCQCAP